MTSLKYFMFCFQRSSILQHVSEIHFFFILTLHSIVCIHRVSFIVCFHGHGRCWGGCVCILYRLGVPALSARADLQGHVRFSDCRRSCQRLSPALHHLLLPRAWRGFRFPHGLNNIYFPFFSVTAILIGGFDLRFSFLF